SAGTLVGITASSTDVNGPAVTYSLIADSSSGGFTIDSASGVVTVGYGSQTAYLQAPSHALCRLAQTIHSTPTSTQTVSIAVCYVGPSTPTDSNAFPTRRSSDLSAGTLVGITASSTDVNGPAVTYSLIADSSSGGFTIDSASGVVTVRSEERRVGEEGSRRGYAKHDQDSMGTIRGIQNLSICGRA